MDIPTELSAANMEINRLSRKLARATSPSNDIAMLHPSFRGAVEELILDLDSQFRRGKTKTNFRFFEGYRSPMRQQELRKKNPPVTQADPWESAHQYGLAADFVAWAEGTWSWHDAHDWSFLKVRAEIHGLLVPIKWDRGHVESPAWKQYGSIYRNPNLID